MQGYWCPYCQGRNKSIKDMEILAKQKEGRILSIAYINSKTKLVWCCKNGHEFKMTPGDVISGSWCPKCGIISRTSKMKASVQEIRGYARKKQGKVIVDSYTDNKQKLEWHCAKGHTWFANWNSVSKGHWCPVCAGLARHTIEVVRDHIESKDGKLLSTSYKNNRTPIIVQCQKGHKWMVQFKKIAIGRWCPVCAGKVENYVRGKIAVFTKNRYTIESKVNLSQSTPNANGT